MYSPGMFKDCRLLDPIPDPLNQCQEQRVQGCTQSTPEALRQQAVESCPESSSLCRGPPYLSLAVLVAGWKIASLQFSVQACWVSASGKYLRRARHGVPEGSLVQQRGHIHLPCVVGVSIIFACHLVPLLVPAPAEARSSQQQNLRQGCEGK